MKETETKKSTSRKTTKKKPLSSVKPPQEAVSDSTLPKESTKKKPASSSKKKTEADKNKTKSEPSKTEKIAKSSKPKVSEAKPSQEIKKTTNKKATDKKATDKKKLVSAQKKVVSEKASKTESKSSDSSKVSNKKDVKEEVISSTLSKTHPKKEVTPTTSKQKTAKTKASAQTVVKKAKKEVTQETKAKSAKKVLPAEVAKEEPETKKTPVAKKATLPPKKKAETVEKKESKVPTAAQKKTTKEILAETSKLPTASEGTKKTASKELQPSKESNKKNSSVGKTSKKKENPSPSLVQIEVDGIAEIIEQTEMDPVEAFSQLTQKVAATLHSKKAHRNKKSSFVPAYQEKKSSSFSEPSVAEERFVPSFRTEKREERYEKRVHQPVKMVKVEIFHPDVQEGGGYVTREVPENQIPLGAKIVGKSFAENKSESYSSPKREQNAFLPSGGILEAGRNWRDKLSQQSEKKVVSPKSAETPAPRKEPLVEWISDETIVSEVAENSVAKAVEKKIEDVEISYYPEIPVVAKESAPSKPALVGNSFLQGLPSSNTASKSLNALEEMFATKEVVPPQKAPVAVPEAKKQPILAPVPASSTPPKARRDMIVLDGRLVENPLYAKKDSSFLIQSVQALPTSHEELSAFSVQLGSDKTSMEAHMFFWKEGSFDILGQVNDSDPRPSLYSEEGILGLGYEERIKSVQKTSIQEWWSRFQKKNIEPVACFAGTQAIRARDQVVFQQDADYNIHRLFQRGSAVLSGEYPMLQATDGKLKQTMVKLDGVDEKERFTPERMQQIFNDSSPTQKMSLAFTAIPFLQEGNGLDLEQESSLAFFVDQLDALFQFPLIQLPNPLGSGSIQIKLGLWEMSGKNKKAEELCQKAVHGDAITLQSSAGFLSDLVRNELWRVDEKVANTWAGFTPKQVADAIRIALKEDHFNMQGFTPKKAGDYRYTPETGEFQIVLKRQASTHSLILQGTCKKQKYLGALVLYPPKGRTGLDPFKDYGAFVQSNDWNFLLKGLQWKNGWLTAPQGESRCCWEIQKGVQMVPTVTHMPAWNLGVAHGIFLVKK